MISGAIRCGRRSRVILELWERMIGWYLWGWRRHIIFRRRTLCRDAGHFGRSVDKLLLLANGGTCRVNDNVIGISWR
jgi:hypothetical protein